MTEFYISFQNEKKIINKEVQEELFFDHITGRFYETLVEEDLFGKTIILLEHGKQIAKYKTFEIPETKKQERRKKCSKDSNTGSSKHTKSTANIAAFGVNSTDIADMTGKD